MTGADFVVIIIYLLQLYGNFC